VTGPRTESRMSADSRVRVFLARPASHRANRVLTGTSSGRFIERVSKKRPREATGLSRAGRPAGTASATPSGWRRRVFRNSYTYRGRRITVKHWSVKIQHQRLRRTISLVAKNRAAAEIEAQAIHQTILTQGWDA